MASFFDKYVESIVNTDTIKYTGSVTAVKGLMIESQGPRSMIGEICRIELPAMKTSVLAEVVGLEGKTVRLMAYGETKGIEVGSQVIASGHVLEIPVGKGLLGRVVDATGKPMDGLGAIEAEGVYPVVRSSSDDALSRPVIKKRISTGVRCIDSLLTVGKGQRLGIFAGSGVGKSTLLGTIAKHSSADLNVIALIGERNREVREFIEDSLGEEGMKRSVVVVATSDTASLCRLRAAYTATAIAEYFRDQGKDVMFMMDNMTRFAHAQREIGLSNGEPPAQRGYPPSVFDLIPKLLERTGTSSKGTITAFYNVLVDGDDMDEPITDKVRGTLDGHIVLTRRLAGLQHYPAIDVQQSISRLCDRVSGSQTIKAAKKLKRWVALYAEQEDMITAGAYARGNSPDVDEAIDKHAAIEEFLCQEKYEDCTMKDTLDKLSQLTGIEIPEEEYSELPQKK